MEHLNQSQPNKCDRPPAPTLLYLELNMTFNRWEKSSHVEHLRKHTKEYVGAVHNFLEDVYFSKLPSADSEEVLEAEVEEEDSREDAKRVAVAK